jgi:hypothetical protein
MVSGAGDGNGNGHVNGAPPVAVGAPVDSGVPGA